MRRSNMTVAKKLILTFGMLLAFLTSILIYSYVSLNHSNDSMKTIYEDRTVALAQLNTVQRFTLEAHKALLDNAVQKKPQETQQALTQYTHQRDAALTEWHAYLATYLTPEEAQIAESMKKNFNAYLEEGLGSVVQALQGNHYDAAIQLLQTRVQEKSINVQQDLNQLINLQTRVAKEVYASASKANKNALLSMIIIGVIAVGVGGLAITLITLQIKRRLGAEPSELAQIAQQIAKGDLTQTKALDNLHPDSVLMAMQTMRQNLLTIVQTVRQGVDSVSTASSEIAEGNMNLSTRTESQAASLEETSASMVQLTSQIKSSSTYAQEANQLAAKATESAHAGGQVVAQVVQTMHNIQNSSRKISEIISVIDSIAFQTNILALNAAVEAARAGEQGRGFAVVAGEVRTLAQRSAQAAKEIKALISTSVEGVESGAKQVADAGKQMDQIVTQIRNVGNLISQITDNSTQQSQGIGQIAAAVHELDHNVQQNAALVEQSAAASASLRDQAQQLSGAVASFQID